MKLTPMNLNWYQKSVLGFFCALVIFWVWLSFTGTKDSMYNYLYAFLYGLIPLFGGIAAMKGVRMWGGLSNAIGKAIFFLGLGLACFGIGETIWSYYNIFLNIDAPYPSLADVFFVPSEFFYATGAIFLAQTTGMGFGLKNIFGKLFVIFTPVLVLAVSYYIFIELGHGGMFGDFNLKTVLDYAYPLGDFVGLTVAILVSGLSFKYLGGEYKWDIISILAGLATMFVADSVFSYTTNIGTQYNGNFGDLIFTVGLFLISFGVLGFNKIKNLTPPQMS